MGEESIVYIPDLPDYMDGGYEGSALVRAYPEKVFRWNTCEPINRQFQDLRHAAATIAVVHGIGWSFFRQAKSFGYFHNVKHVVALAANEIDVPFKDKPRNLSPISYTRVLHAIPKGAGRAWYEESALPQTPGDKVAILHDMHPSMREVWKKRDDGTTVQKEFTSHELQDLVEKLVVMVKDPVVVEMHF
jgi:hypothetical protein